MGYKVNCVFADMLAMDLFQGLKFLGIKGWPAIALAASGCLAHNYFASGKDLFESKEAIRKRENITLLQTVEAFRMSEDRIRDLEEKLKLKRRHQASLYDALHALQVQYADVDNPNLADRTFAGMNRVIASPEPPLVADDFSRELAALTSTADDNLEKEELRSESPSKAETGWSATDLLVLIFLPFITIGLIYQRMQIRKLSIALKLLGNEKSSRVNTWELIHREHFIKKVG